MIKNRIILFWFAAVLLFPVDPAKLLLQPDDGFPPAFKLSDSDKAWVEEKLSHMSMRDKCAQMIFPFALSKDTSNESEDYQRLAKLVKDYKVGGVIFYQGEIHKQAALTNKLQAMSEIPLMICSDYERGLGMRLSDAVQFPYNMAVAAANSPDLTYLVGKYIAEDARSLGVHVNFAPLLDVNRDYRNPIINIRAYSESLGIVSLHGSAFINGMNEGEMISVAKHFPGHGSTILDSHSELSMVHLPKHELKNIDLVPFRRAIKNGVKGIMIGHLIVPSLGSSDKSPATFLNNIVSGLLKRQMQFSGLVFTDALNMHSIVKSYSNEEAAIQAVRAGNNVILFPADEIAAIDGIYKAVLNKKIPSRLIDESVRKILVAKKWLGLDETKVIDENSVEDVINNATHRRLAEEIAAKSITLVKDNNNLIPIDPNKYYKTALITINQTRGRSIEKSLFESLVNDEFGYMQDYRINLSSSKSNYDKALKIAEQSNLILLSTFLSVKAYQGTVQLDADHVKLIKDLIALHKPIVMANFGNPYLLSDFPDVPVYLCSYGDVDASQRAMINALLGRTDITGRLPISIPNTNYKLGDGIEKKYSILHFDKANGESNYNFKTIDSLMQAGVDDSVFPGGVLLVGYSGEVIYNKAFGQFEYDKHSRNVNTNSIFDLASLTKVIVTTSAAMFLCDEGKLDLDKTVVSYLPEFGINGKQQITIRNLLLHNSGLPAFISFHTFASDAVTVIDSIMNLNLNSTPGSKYVYSDLGMITLQQVIEKITGQGLDEFLNKKLFELLGMTRTMFNPSPRYWYDCLPTEHDNYWRMKTLKGKVHDETAYLLGGVAGHAGLFSTAHDLAILAQTYLNNGLYDGKQIFKPETIRTWTKKQTSQSSRALGWDTKSESGYTSAGQKFSNESFGHTGFTGTSIWIDKKRNLFVVLLTNRVNPSRKNIKIIDFRPLLYNAVVDAIDFK